MFGYPQSYAVPGLVQSAGAQASPYAKSVQYTIRSVALRDHLITINQKKYKFGGELGAGGFGVVYSGRRVTDNKPVAIKVISLASRNTEEAKLLGDSMLNEIRMTKKLRKGSNHIINLYDFDFHHNTGLAFMVMERGERDLEQALQHYGHLTPQLRKQLWLQLANIAYTLHNQGIVHLDIKPSNLLVFPQYHVKLIDLGIAQRAATQRHEGYGTMLYSAPEVVGVVSNHRPPHSSVPDAWSWGAVLYRVTYDHPPSYDEPCYKPPHSKRPSRDPNVIDLLKHTLVRDPSHRVNGAWLAAHRYSSP